MHAHKHSSYLKMFWHTSGHGGKSSILWFQYDATDPHIILFDGNRTLSKKVKKE